MNYYLAARIFAAEGAALLALAMFLRAVTADPASPAFVEPAVAVMFAALLFVAALAAPSLVIDDLEREGRAGFVTLELCRERGRAPWPTA